MEKALISRSQSALGNFGFVNDLYSLLENAPSDGNITYFSTYRWPGFILENSAIWLGCARDDRSNHWIELTFHNLPDRLIDKLRTAESLKIRSPLDGEEMLDFLPFSIALFGKINPQTKLPMGNAIYVHRGDLRGTRIDANDDCSVGRTIQAFSERLGSKQYGPFAHNWFEHASRLLEMAFEKYSFSDKI